MTTFLAKMTILTQLADDDEFVHNTDYTPWLTEHATALTTADAYLHAGEKLTYADVERLENAWDALLVLLDADPNETFEVPSDLNPGNL